MRDVLHRKPRRVSSSASRWHWHVKLSVISSVWALSCATFWSLSHSTCPILLFYYFDMFIFLFHDSHHLWEWFYTWSELVSYLILLWVDLTTTPSQRVCACYEGKSWYCFWPNIFNSPHARCSPCKLFVAVRTNLTVVTIKICISKNCGFYLSKTYLQFVNGLIFCPPNGLITLSEAVVNHSLKQNLETS